MNKRTENWIYQLRIRGLGYKSIAMALDMTPETVRYYCIKHGLGGKGEDLRDLYLYEMYKENPTECKNCGAVLIRNRHSGKKYFCSDKCRQYWWQKHRDEINYSGDKIFTHTCKYCGKEFTSYGEHTKNTRKYCGRECYLNDRFGERHTLKELSVRIKEWSVKRVDCNDIK